MRELINSPPKAHDPPLWIFLGLVIGTIAFGILAIAARGRTWWALLALLATILSLVAVWTLAALGWRMTRTCAARPAPIGRRRSRLLLRGLLF